MNYKSVKGLTLRPNLEKFAAYDKKDIIYSADSSGHKSLYYIKFFTGSGEFYDWEFKTEKERDDVYDALPQSPIEVKK